MSNNNLKIVEGDLLSADADAICQQVNCQGVMGAGLAKAICTKWPVVRQLYYEYCNDVGAPFALLGRVHVVREPGIPFDIVNVFGQLNYGRKNFRYTHYYALETAFKEIDRIYAGKKVAFPYGFGCGLAGGDWDVVSDLIARHLKNCDVYIYRKE